MNLWIDLASAPQVQLYRPIIAEFKRRGHSVTTTARDFLETRALAELYGLPIQVVGAHGGQSSLGKLAAILSRAAQLALLAKRERVDFALGHNSHAQSLAAGLLRLPLVIMTDYEYQPAHYLGLRFARRVLIPEAVDANAMVHYGLALQRVERYNGIKEDIYLSDFAPQPDFRQQHSIPADKIVVVMRPPATMSAYHRMANPLFDQVLEFVAGQTNVFVLLFPRTQDQARYAAGLNLKNIQIPEHVLDGPNAIYWSDLVISAGGTMNREASALGTPAYTVFAGRMGGVDRWLMDQGRLVQVQSDQEFEKIKLAQKATWYTSFGKRELVPEIVDRILTAVR